MDNPKQNNSEQLKKIASLEKQMLLLNQALKQSDKIKKLWQQSLEDLKEAKDSLEQADKEMKLSAQVIKYSYEAIFITDEKAIIQVINPAFTEITGLSPKEALQKNANILCSRYHDKAFYKNLWSSVMSDGFWQGEIWNRKKSGALYPAWLTISAIRDKSNKITNYIAILDDISERKAFENQLKYRANHDVLTDLPNTALFLFSLKQSMLRAKRNKTITALLFADLDNFKEVNDHYGHAAGDVLLKEVSQRLQTNLREDDLVSRIGGDEFTIILNDIKSKKNAEEKAGQLIQAISLPYQLQGHQYSIGMSIGICFYPGDTDDPEELIKFADQAMYKAKAAGKNQCKFFE